MLRRPAPLHREDAEICVSGGRDVAEPAMRPDRVVVGAPGRQDCPGMIERREQRCEIASNFDPTPEVPYGIDIILENSN